MADIDDDPFDETLIIGVVANAVCSACILWAEPYLDKQPDHTSSLSVAIAGIMEELRLLNSTIRLATVTEDGIHHSVHVASNSAITPFDAEIQKSAVDLLLEKETYLDDDSLITMLDLFSTDITQARMYTIIKRDSLRRCWVKRELEKAGHMVPDFTPHSEVALIENAKKDTNNWGRSTRRKRKREQDDEDIERFSQSCHRLTRSQSRLLQGGERRDSAPTHDGDKMDDGSEHMGSGTKSQHTRTFGIHKRKRQKPSNLHATVKR
ncbi:hypothetical protein JOM56_011174 [Amanita muscaria]